MFADAVNIIIIALLHLKRDEKDLAVHALLQTHKQHLLHQNFPVFQTTTTMEAEEAMTNLTVTSSDQQQLQDELWVKSVRFAIEGVAQGSVGLVGLVGE